MRLARVFDSQIMQAQLPNGDATLGEHILDVAVAQSEAEIEPDRLLDDDAGKRWRRYDIP